MNGLSVQVGVSGTSFAFDQAYSYSVPDNLADKAVPGSRVIVPFGRSDRRRVGIIVGVCTDTENVEGLKAVSSVVDNTPIIGDEQLKLLLWLRDTVFCTYYEAFRTLIPPGLGVSFTQKYRLSPKKPKKGELSDKAMGLYLSASETDDGGELAVMISEDGKSASELIEKGFLEEIDLAKQRVRDDTVSMVRLTDHYSEKNIKLTPKQKAAAEILEREGCASVRELCYMCGCTSQVVKNMVKSGAAELFDYEVLKAPETIERDSVDDIVLNGSQQAAFDGISQMISEKKAAAALLFGVTGSGKTPVFAKLIDHTLRMGRNVIMLIPEISLTPQTLNRFRRLFGETVAVLHSGLSLSMRSNEYKRVKSGQCRIVVGTRSAVFAPLDNIGLIIMDEEGERTYKSESSPRYHAKDAAAQRCLYHNALLLTASATPSIESYYSAEKGRTKLFVMPDRYSPDPSVKAAMPRAEIIDMTGSGRVLSEELVSGINDNLSRGEQSILLLNRRGYHTFITCSECREPLACPNCSIPLTYHKVNNRLICHYCGYSQDYTDKCPKCGSTKLKLSGMGTQRLEDELAEFFPGARILRMDADTTYSRYAYDKRFTAFGNGEYDIMVGTQMIAKGLDFPNVTLVGVLNADKSLYSGDFRSYERTFSLITQVVGRSGRGNSRGRALIQTFAPDHYVINLAAQQNYTAFYEQEIAMRRALIYPPFCDICAVGFSGEDDKKTGAAADIFAEKIAEGIKNIPEKMPVRVLGPSKCVFEKINGKFRYRIIIKCRNNSQFRSFISGVRTETARLPEFRGISVYLDMNGDISL
ncbi:replication restart helicase PriA [Huintestinicola sp.]|uniref:replication restart helicase PriA n=1 Tax=Huintestinicola sp. TaxID=2981661 RepID=UPI003D7D9202